MTQPPIDLKNFRITYLTCNLGGLHDGQNLNYVCLDLKCKQRGIICSVCKIQKHQGHRTVPLKLFLADLTQKLASKTKLGNKQQLLNNVQVEQAKLMFSLKQAVDNMAKRVKVLEQAALKTYKRVKQRIETQCFMSENMPKVIESIATGSFFDCDALKEECRKMMDTIQIRPSSIDVDFKADKVLLDFKNCITDFDRNMKKLNTLLADQFVIVEKTFDQLNAANQVSIQVIVPTFTENNQGKNINLSAENQVATQSVLQTTNENRYVLLDPVLEKDLRTRWAIKVVQTVSWIGIGVGLKKKLQAKAFKSDFSQLNHGAFMVAYNGYTVNSFQQEENNVSQGFTFQANEIITVELDAEKKTLTFQQKSTGIQLVLNIEVPPDDDLLPIVNLNGQDDAVEIISEVDTNEEI